MANGTTTDKEKDVKADAPDLPEPVARRGISEAQWRTLCDSLFPGANPRSVLMVIDYCAARKLDPLKKPCHIVPMKVKDARTGQYDWRDVVMPGIYEIRTTAHRTGVYLGHSKIEYGPMVERFGVTAPEWLEATFYRAHTSPPYGRIEFPVRRYFAEIVGLKDGHANDRWSRAPIQMAEKCLEAAGLREAFPEEFGGEQTAEEMEGVVEAEAAVAPPQPAQRKSQQPPAALPAPEAADRVVAPAEKVPLPSQAESSSHQSLASPSAGTETIGGNPAPAPASPAIGQVVTINERENAVVVKLDTGFQCATRDPEMIAGLKALKESGKRVELIARPARDPRYVPILTEILPL